MKDRFFFPAAAAVAAAMILLALQPFSDRPPRGPLSGGGRNAEDVVLEGRELHRFIAGETGALSVEPNEEGVDMLTLSLGGGAEYADPRAGPHVALAEDLEFAFENRPVEVTIVARSKGEFAAGAFEAAYLARPGQDSGWRRFELTPDFASYVFQWTTPPRGSSQGYDFIGVRPVAPDNRRTLDIRSVRIRSVGPKETAEAPAP
jgi:hypothetical protein